MRAGKRQGFSLIEMIVAVTITAVLAGAVYTTFSQGLRLWNRGSKDRAEWKIRLFAEQLTAELKNSFLDPRGIFQGGKNEIAFSTIGHENGIAGDLIYVDYRYDPRNRTLIRQQRSFKEMFSARPVQKPLRPVLEKVGSFGLEYYAYDPTAKGHRWFQTWNRNCFPETVKVTIEPDGGEGRKIMSMIDLPVRVACPS